MMSILKTIRWTFSVGDIVRNRKWNISANILRRVFSENGERIYVVQTSAEPVKLIPASELELYWERV